MSTTNNERADFPSLYERTGDITDINTLLVPRASLAANAPAAEPVAWPKDAAEVRQFMGSNFICAEFVGSDESPNDDDRYLLSAHDFLSAVDWWTGSATDAPPAPTEQWVPIADAPKDGIWQDGNNHYAEYILVWYPGAHRPMRARWWFRDDSDCCNFLADGGYAVFPTVYQPLPAPPQGAANKDKS